MQCSVQLREVVSCWSTAWSVSTEDRQSTDAINGYTAILFRLFCTSSLCRCTGCLQPIYFSPLSSGLTLSIATSFVLQLLSISILYQMTSKVCRALQGRRLDSARWSNRWGNLVMWSVFVIWSIWMLTTCATVETWGAVFSLSTNMLWTMSMTSFQTSRN